METPGTHAYAVGQRVRSRGLYHTGEVGTVIILHPTTPRPGYIVEFAAGACVFLREEEAEPVDAQA
jgi:hypothetical protein